MYDTTSHGYIPTNVTFFNVSNVKTNSCTMLCGKNKAGFTLLEVMIALLIVGVLIIGTVELITIHSRLQTHIKNKVIGQLVAWNDAIDLLMFPPQTISTDGGSKIPFATNEWSRKRTITDLPSFSLQRVVITSLDEKGTPTGNLTMYIYKEYPKTSP